MRSQDAGGEAPTEQQLWVTEAAASPTAGQGQEPQGAVRRPV